MKSAAGAVVYGALVAVFIVSAAFTLRSAAFREGSFKAFYCAGKIVLQRGNPYRVEPLRTCEHETSRRAYPAGYVEPAPLPAFALAPFAALATLRVQIAGAMFAIALVCAGLFAVRLLADVTRAPPAAVLAVLLPLLLLNLALGEIPPFALLAVTVAGWALVKDRPHVAGVAAALALIEPHIGLPVAIAVALWDKRTRVPGAAAAGALAVISVIALGVHANFEYLVNVLPAQAASELTASDQYSLSRIAYASGAPARTALLLGELSYVALGWFGIAAGFRAARAWNAPAAAAFVPAAAVLLGGVFMHDIQMVAAIPAALLFAISGPRSRRALAAAALILLAAVWTQHFGRSIALVDAVGVAGAAFVIYGGRGRALLVHAAAVVFCVLGLVALNRVQPVPRAADLQSAPFTAVPSEPASLAWQRYERATPALAMPRYYQQLPTWIGLLLLLGGIAGAGNRPRLQFAEGKVVEAEIERGQF